MLDDILRLLDSSSLLHDLQIVEIIVYGQSAFRAKLRSRVTEELTFQVWLNHNEHRTRYAYQLFRRSQPILRWDNAPHHPEHGTNFPHHFHDESGRLLSSALSGNPLDDIMAVLLEIEVYLRSARRE